MALVPKTSRSSTVTVASATAGPFALGFRLFDDDTIHVYVDDVQRTDWTLNRTYTNGFADGATITFDATLSIGDVLRIDSALTPDRAVDYASGDPNLPGNLNVELARVWSALADLRRDVDTSVRVLGGRMKPAPLTPGVSLIINPAGDGFEAGPDATSIAGAQAAATTAVTARDEAVAAAATSVVNRYEWQGAWLTTTAYGLSDVVSQSGNLYLCIVAHTSGTFSTDLSAGRWELFLPQGAAGAGTGDVLAANNGSEFTPATFAANLQIRRRFNAAYAGNLDSITADGMYLLGTGATGGPAGVTLSDGDFLDHMTWDANNAVQTLYDYPASSTAPLAIRYKASGTWQAWQPILSNPSFVGMVAAFAMNAAPVGWLKADGAAVSRTTYAALFAAISTTFGVGNGSTTFNLPDLRGEFVRGWVDGKTLAPETGRAFGSGQTDAFQAHTHQLRTGRGGSSDPSRASRQDSSGNIVVSDTAITTTIANGGGTPRTADETRPRNVALLYCIKF